MRLPDEVINEIDRLVRAGTFATRAAAVQAGVDRLLAAEPRHDLDEQLLAGYRRHPAPRATRADHALADDRVDEEPW